MEFVTARLRDRLLVELGTATQADIAVAYFCPEASTLAALQSVPRLNLLVSNDFQINNPQSLEALHQNGKWVRALSPEEHGGNLHAKVYLVTRKDGSLWAMVGSANLTRSGLLSNQEACVLLDSKDRGDGAQLSVIRDWIHGLFRKDLPEIDFELAKAVHKTQNQQHEGSSPPTVTTGYWAMKPGRNGECWLNWLAENVVSIGWRQLPDTSRMSRPQAVAAYRAARPEDADGKVNTNVPQILNFTQNIEPGQLILICGRYDGIGTTDREVHIYGVARTVEVGGENYFFDSKATTGHRCKRYARIQQIGRSLSRGRLAQATGRGSFVPTIMQLDQQAFTEVKTVLREELGVVLWV